MKPSSIAQRSEASASSETPKISEVATTRSVATKRRDVATRTGQAIREPEPVDAAARRGAGWMSWAVMLLCVGGGLFLIGKSIDWIDGGPTAQPLSIRPIPAQYDPDRAMDYLVALCDLGPRPTGSPAMLRQQALLTEHFESLGGTVRLQKSNIRHPETGAAVEMANLIATWHPNRPKRFLLCAHYDTRPFPDSDRKHPKGVFVGANDGASGTAALMELAHQLGDLPADVGIDLVLFDAEEFIFDADRDDDLYFLGSIHFAQQYKMSPPSVPYLAGILLDMVGDKELKIYYEVNSLRYARDVVISVWQVAKQLGVRAFVPRSRHEIRDDHLPLNEIAGIPTVDLIDFDYPRPGLGAPRYWHTENDVPANCSGESMATVIWVVHEWLKRQ